MRVILVQKTQNKNYKSPLKVKLCAYFLAGNRNFIESQLVAWQKLSAKK